jgi:hypothetical protein
MSRPDSAPLGSQVLLEAALVGLLVALSRLDWLTSTLYHDTNNPWDAWAAMGLLFLTVAISASLPALVVGERRWGYVLRGLIFVAALYVLQAAIRHLPFIPTTLNNWHKLGAISVCLVVAAMMAIKFDDALWGRTRAALVTASVIYAVSPWMLVQWSAPHVQVSLNTQSNSFPTAILLLDEMNAEAALPVLSALRRVGANVQAATIPSVGVNTITVVPEMLGAAHVPTAKVCTANAICDATGQFDFRKLNFAPEQGFHIVGFFHPYCAAHGWVSCQRFALTSPGAFRSLACTFLRLVPVASSKLTCDWMSQSSWLPFRERILDAVMQSSFWHQGGVLFAHLPIPHPVGQHDYASLQADYDDNITVAAGYMADIWVVGRKTHGENFRLVITSDHPLRPNLWCSHVKYRRTGCAVQANSLPGKVPFIVASSHPIAYPIPTSNSGIFKTFRDR